MCQHYQHKDVFLSSPEQSSRSMLHSRWLYYSLSLMLMLILSGCALFSGTSYSIDEQFSLSATRSVQMSDQLEFSFKFVPESVPAGHDIFFVATFTNTTNHSIVFREPKQYGVSEIWDGVLFFDVEPISVTVPFKYPREVFWETLGPLPPVKPDEFMTIPSLGKHEVRLELPRFVFQNGKENDVISLPAGRYLVHMTYYNPCIGYKVEQRQERFVDLGAWVGEIESKPASFTITP